MLTGISRGLEKEGARREREGLGTRACAGAVPADEGGHSCELPQRPVADDGLLWPRPSPGGESECLIGPSLLHPSIPGTEVGSRNSCQQENNSTDCGGADSLGTVGCHGNRRKLILGSATYP